MKLFYCFKLKRAIMHRYSNSRRPIKLAPNSI